MWRMRKIVRRLARERRFDVVHACNPPDFLLLAARGLRRQGTRFVFDHHDLVPELYRSKFGGGKGLLYRVFVALEKVAFRMADVVISTNESYRRIALERGGKDASDVFVVRNGPDLERFRPVDARSRATARRAAPDRLPRDHGPAGRRRPRGPRPGWLGTQRTDWRAVFIGEGDVLDEMARSPPSWASPTGSTSRAGARRRHPPDALHRRRLPGARIPRARSTTSRR